MLIIKQSSTFSSWLDGLRDENARGRILVRMRRLSLGNPGDVKPVGSGISEMRVDYGPGYRVYYKQQGRTIAVLLCGGDKSTQTKDIERAKQIAKEWESEHDGQKG